MMSFISYFINGLSLGSVYAIIALGYTMVYGIAKMLNFAHGDVIMIGGYVVFTVVSTMGLPPAVGILLAVIICTVLGVTIEKVAYRPLRMASPLAVLITAIGVSYLLQNIALLVFGSNPKSFTSVVTIPALKLAGGRLTISGETLVTIVSCIVIMIVLTTFIKKTRAGQAMLAVSEDKGAAQLMGINVNAMRIVISLIAVLLASISTAVAGVISFLGLIVPHIGRILVGSDHKALVPFSALFGAFTFLLADTIGRTIAAPYEVSASIIMSVVGGPFFIILLRRSKKYAK